MSQCCPDNQSNTNTSNPTNNNTASPTNTFNPRINVNPVINIPSSQPNGNGCIPRTGELMINGGFEDPQTFFGWQIDPINNGVRQITEAHSGQKAAALGSGNQQQEPEQNAILFQEVSGICPGKHYELLFVMNGVLVKANSPVDVRVIWLDENKNILGLGLQITVTEHSLPDDNTGTWTTFQGVTNAAPPQTRFARVRFEIHSSPGASGSIQLDDVSLKLAANG